MGSKKSLGELGWTVVADNGIDITFRKGYDMFAVAGDSKTVYLGETIACLTFDELSAILDFIKEGL